MVRSFFPSLFQFGVDSINYSDVIVSRSHINDNCVIIKARKPLEWLLDHVSGMGVLSSWIDHVSIRHNSDGSLSVFDV